MSVVQVLSGTAIPVALALLWRRWSRATGASWASWGLGALVFVLSQVAHLPLNVALDRAFGPSVRAIAPATAAIVWAVVLGLSAGVCEEGARYAFFQLAGARRKDGGARRRDEAVMVGLGHGGIESILFGTLLVALTLSQLVALQRTGVEHLGLDDAARAAVQAQLDSLRSAPWFVPLLGATERLMVQPFHVSATMLVLYGTVGPSRHRFGFVLLAVLWHAVLDAGSVWLLGTYGVMTTELFILATVPVSVGIIWAVYRALPVPADAAIDGRIEKAEPSGAPLELVLASKRYGAHPALHQASFVLPKGSRTCLLGPNGAGKTTAIRLALGALAPTEGRAWLFGAGHDADALIAAKRRVGVVPQQAGMYEDLTVREYLELVRALYGRGDIAAIAERLELGPLLDRPMSKHSGGQQRRIALAAALLPEPELLILDEPSAGLDPVAQRTMREVLSTVSENRTVLLCTHDLEEADALCERVLILEAGEVKVDERIDVLRSRQQRWLRVRAKEGPSAVLSALHHLGRRAEMRDGDARTAIADRSEAPAILRALLTQLDVQECTVLEASLEEIFLAAVHHPSEVTDDLA